MLASKNVVAAKGATKQAVAVPLRAAAPAARAAVAKVRSWSTVHDVVPV